ncbi:putative peptidyl-prolyl cis-trans isomerase A [Octadecabacter antarcticus 307]|uniref:Peptidyl-prolyl cis-trans isomerase n=1 Tax=Octadecabacter antarcticus 307 TaxID=391626 RepID=M9R803_9RHOB|nr:peptidylprolyl isomerase [Octadecabacter antarcticus]AGI68362.1 putative peptidyl-prolyl cis-trans isomerase A [Octadecabacter antarcticus 307]
MLKGAVFATLLAGAAGADGIGIDVTGDATGTVFIDLFEDIAPLHAAQITALAADGAYDGVVFHRVIDGFMAQTGDVQFGDMTDDQFDMRRAGTGSSELNDIALEATTELSFTRGMVGMARSQNPNSANSQFFIMFDDGAFLDGQYTIVGEVVAGMDVVDAIKLGDGPNGAVIGDADAMDVVRVISADELTEIVDAATQ